MRKIFSILVICFMFLTLSIPGFAYEETNVRVKDVQTTEIDFVFKKGELKSDLLKNLPSDIKAYESDNNIALRLVVSNVDFQTTFKSEYKKLINAFEKYQPDIAKDFNEKNIEITSAFYGYPFGGRTLITLDGDIDNNINVIVNGKYALNDGEYISEGTITPGDMPATIEFGTNTIDSLEIEVTPQSNYKTINVKYTIYSESGKLKSMSESDYIKEGFTVLNLSENQLVIEETYYDLDAFNNLFTLNLGRYFNIIGTINVNSSKSLMKNMTVEGMFVDSETIDNVLLTVQMPEKSEDSISGYSGEKFTYDISGAAKMNIGFKTVNMSTLVILIIVPVCIIFVIASLLMLNKRSAHIKIK